MKKRESKWNEKLLSIYTIRTVILFVCLNCSSLLFAQLKTITGIVMDTGGEAIIGASVSVTGTTRGTVTDLDGKFSIQATAQESLTITYMGYEKQEVAIGNRTVFHIVLKEDTKLLDEVVVVAYGTQKRESMVSSIETINPKELKVPSSNLTTALAGRLSGVIAYQRSGEPGKDDADFFIRGVTTFGYKKDPLILIDGIETSKTELARLTPDDIEAFSILKDATATALYGARGANGVIQVKTKEGKVGPAKVQIRLENSFSSNTRNIELADPISYMLYANEEANSRPLQTGSIYSLEKIDQTRRGANPYVYPANDWYNLLMKDVASNQRANLNLSGGGGVARYYIAAAYTKDNGNLKVDKRNNYNSNINLQSYQLRSNINIDVTKTTEAIIRISGSFDDYTGPLDGGEKIYQRIMQTNPVKFPAYFPAEYNPGMKHILFGNDRWGTNSAAFVNPYAEMVKGYKDSGKSLIDASFELKQDFNFIIKGLNARVLFNTSRYSFFDLLRSYNPYFYKVESYDKFSGEPPVLELLNGDNTGENKPTEYLNYSPGGKDVNSTVYVESALTYNRTFGIHDVSGLLVYHHRQQLYSDKTTLQESLPFRNQGISGRFTYGFDSRYLAEFNFGYNGSERFHKSERYGFFPAIGLGWIVSNESFWGTRLGELIPKLKLKGSYGLVGNDAIGDERDRFFYLSEMNMDDGGRGYQFGYVNSNPYGQNGVRIRRYDNKDITWETAYKTNVGFELNLLGDIEFQAEYFTEYRENILMTRTSIPSTMGLSADVRANVGKAKSNGVDFSIDYNKYFSSGYWLQGRANFTYAHSEYLVYEELDYKEKYKLKVGNPINQRYGLIAERLFVDEYEVLNSPVQVFGEYGAGDIKYRDVNGDGVVDDFDQVPLGYPEVPEIVYGFGASFGNDNFDFSVFFQGQARSSFWIDAEATHPFRYYVDSDDNDTPKDIPLLKAYADSHWSESNRDLYALWPKFGTNTMTNNTKTSSWFMRNGAFLRLKTVEIGYKLPKSLLSKAHLDNVRIYLTGNNLFLFSGFDLWDIEMGGNGLGYPIQRVINMGIQVGF